MAESNQREQFPEDYRQIAERRDITVRFTSNDPGYQFDLGISGGIIVCKKDPISIAGLVKLARTCARNDQDGDHIKILNLVVLKAKLGISRPHFMQLKRKSDITNPDDWVSVRQLLEDAKINIESLCKLDPVEPEITSQASNALEGMQLPQRD